MRKLVIAAAFAALVPIASWAQSDADLTKADKDTHNIFYGGGYSQMRYSPLSQINASNVKDLVPAWALQLSNDKAQEEQPILWNGVFYLADHNATLCVAETEKLTTPEIRTANYIYFRFRQPSYSAEEVKKLAERVRKWVAEGVETYAFFKHEEDPRSPLNAVELLRQASNP